MTGEAMTLRAVERALVENAPVHETLRGAARAMPTLWPTLDHAARIAEGGDLKNAVLALHRLGMDPIVAEVAVTDPQAAGAASAKLSTLPRFAFLAQPFYFTLGYVVAVALFQVVVLFILSNKVLSALIEITPAAPALFVKDLGPLLATAATWAVPAVIVLFVFRKRWALRGVQRALDAARVCIAASALADRFPDAARTLLSKHDARLAQDHLTSPGALADLAHSYTLEAARRSHRAAVWARGIGLVLLAVLALLVSLALFTLLPLLSKVGA